MKKLLYCIAGLLTATFVVSCGLVPDASSENDSDSLVLDSIALGDLEFRTENKYFIDSLDQNGVEIYYSVNLDIPVSGNPALVDSIKAWMHGMLGKSYEGEVNFDDAMLKHYAAEYFQECDEEGLFEGLGAYLEREVKLVTDSLNFVTFEVNGYDYTGGAHGMPYFYGASFNKDDGSQLGWDMFADTTQLAPIIKAQIEDYFDDTDMNIEESLFDGVYDNFPLPYTEPWFTAGGVKFVYSAYEIAPYVAGMPECTVPYKKVEKYFSERAKAMLKK